LARPVVDEERERVHRLPELADVDEARAQRREEKRRRLARGAGHGEHDAGQDARPAGRQDHRQDNPPGRHAQGEAGLPDLVRDESQDLFGRPHDDGDHDERQRHAARGRVELLERQDEERVRDDADEDRRDPDQDVGREADRAGRPPACELVDVHAAEDADGDRDERGQGHHLERTEDRVEGAATRPERLRGLGEQVQVQRRGALDHDEEQDRGQRDHADDRGDEGHRPHHPVDDAAA
jgi:hypothetical protein